MRRLLFSLGALALVAVAGCGEVKLGEPSIEQLGNCAKGSALYVEALERSERIEKQPSEATPHMKRAVEASLWSAELYRQRGCNFDPRIARREWQ